MIYRLLYILVTDIFLDGFENEREFDGYSLIKWLNGLSFIKGLNGLSFIKGLNGLSFIKGLKGPKIICSCETSSGRKTKENMFITIS